MWTTMQSWQLSQGRSSKGDKLTECSLIVKPGAKITAEGTAAKPIVFTSSAAKGARNYGDWGGIILLGKAPVNKTPATIEGGKRFDFWRNRCCRQLRCVEIRAYRVRRYWFETDKDQRFDFWWCWFSELRSTTYRCHIATTMHMNGLVGLHNAKHLISYRTLDDDFDTDWGFSGNVQYEVWHWETRVSRTNVLCSDSNGSRIWQWCIRIRCYSKKQVLKFSNMSIFIASGTVNCQISFSIPYLQKFSCEHLQLGCFGFISQGWPWIGRWLHSGKLQTGKVRLSRTGADWNGQGNRNWWYYSVERPNAQEHVRCWYRHSETRCSLQHVGSRPESTTTSWFSIVDRRCDLASRFWSQHLYRSIWYNRLDNRLDQLRSAEYMNIKDLI